MSLDINATTDAIAAALSDVGAKQVYDYVPVSIDTTPSIVIRYDRLAASLTMQTLAFNKLFFEVLAVIDDASGRAGQRQLAAWLSDGEQSICRALFTVPGLKIADIDRRNFTVAGVPYTGDVYSIEVNAQ